MVKTSYMINFSRSDCIEVVQDDGRPFYERLKRMGVLFNTRSEAVDWLVSKGVLEAVDCGAENKHKQGCSHTNVSIESCRVQVLLRQHSESSPTAKPPCCRKCFKLEQDEAARQGKLLAPWFIVCAECGNKRCPKASDHTYECTGSNKPGQTGSVYK